MNVNEKWIERITSLLDLIKKRHNSVDDRLSMLASMFCSVNSIMTSLNGWNKWVTNYDVINVVSKDDLHVIETAFHDISVKLLNLDAEITKKYAAPKDGVDGLPNLDKSDEKGMIS